MRFHPVRTRRRQRGFALILAVLLVLSGVGVGLFAFLGSSRISLESDRQSAEALSHAREALIAYAVKGSCFTDALNTPTPACPVPRWNWRPGAFPCPDADNDGIEEMACAAGAPGRLPWKTLGMPQPRDGAGETLWYAVADRFRSTSPLPINSDTPGSITVYASDGATTLTTEAVAVIFAAGVTTGPQDRSAQSAFCTASLTTIARNSCADNYLDLGAGRNNATANGPFIVGQLRDRAYPNYNDQVVYLTPRDFMPAVEMRVGSELETRLEDYSDFSSCQCYPWADSFAGPDGISDDKLMRGRFPVIALPEGWGTGAIPLLPAWVAANNWHDVIYYSVSSLYAKGGKGRKCKDPENNDCVTGTLTVDGKAGVEALFFMPGVPRPGIARPGNALSAYLEDGENNDGANDVYVEPTATELNRDRLFFLSGASTSLCQKNARKLIRKAPCLANGAISQRCQKNVDKLSICSAPCAGAAQAMLLAPCSSDLTSEACQAVTGALRQC